MAASLILPSPSFNIYRLRQRWLHMYPDQLQKRIMYLSVHSHNGGYNSKLYMIQGGSISCRCALRPFAATGSLELDGTHQGHQASSSAGSPNNLQGSEKLLDSRKNPLEGTTDFERELQELFNEVKAMIKMGNKKDAINLLQANYVAVKGQMDCGSRGIEEAAILDIIALGYMAVGNLKMVGSVVDMLSEVVDGLTDDEPLLDSVLMHIGSMHSTLGKFEKSMLAYRRSVEILERECGKSSNFLIIPLLGMAKAMGSIGRATKAVAVYHRVITILEWSKGPESEDLLVPLIGLGNLLMKQGRAMDAENAFIRILNIYTKLYGKNDGRVGVALCSLAHVKCANGNADEAVHLYRNAIQVFMETECIPLDDNTVEIMRIDLAESLHFLGRGKEGRELLEECVFITEKFNGEKHPSLVAHLVNLATAYSYAKNFVEAERLLRRSLQIMTETLGPDDQSITFPMLHLAVTLHSLTRYEEAEQIAMEVLLIREKAFGKESVPVGEALDCLVSIQTKLGKDDSELLESLKRVLKIQEKAFGYESEQVMQSLKRVMHYLGKLGLRDEKLPLQRRLSALRERNKRKVQY